MAGQVQRLGDPNSGGGLIMNGDPTVLVNGRPIATIGCKVTPHPPGQGLHVTGFTTANQYTVVVNGKPVATTTAVDTCGHPRTVGSLDVIIGAK